MLLLLLSGEPPSLPPSPPVSDYEFEEVDWTSSQEEQVALALTEEAMEDEAKFDTLLANNRQWLEESNQKPHESRLQQQRRQSKRQLAEGVWASGKEVIGCESSDDDCCSQVSSLQQQRRESKQPLADGVWASGKEVIALDMSDTEQEGTNKSFSTPKRRVHHGLNQLFATPQGKCSSGGHGLNQLFATPQGKCSSGGSSCNGGMIGSSSGACCTSGDNSSSSGSSGGGDEGSDMNDAQTSKVVWTQKQQLAFDLATAEHKSVLLIGIAGDCKSSSYCERCM